MPIYEYICAVCGYRFERLESFDADKQVKCPQCGDTANRQLSTGTGVVMNNRVSTTCERTSPCCGRDTPCEKRPCD
jgi:putative FmdB family regulatory protein